MRACHEQANEQARLIERSAFYCDAINQVSACMGDKPAINAMVSLPNSHCNGNAGLQEDFDLKGDYVRWRQKRGFAFAAHAFMYTPASKAELLRIENQLEMCACCSCAMLLCLRPQQLLELGAISHLALVNPCTPPSQDERGA